MATNEDFGPDSNAQKILHRDAKLRHGNLPLEGHFGIGVYQGKCNYNLGVLWRGAYQLGASYIYTIGNRYRKDSGDVFKTWKRIPLFSYSTMDEMKSSAARESQIVGIEMGGTPLPEFEHPERAVYLLGAEDGGLPNHAKEQCHSIVSLPSIRIETYNVAQAGTLVMYDRMIKLGQTTQT